MGDLLKFFNAAIGFVAACATGILTWLRSPGSVLKLCCAGLALGLAVACLASWRQSQRVVVITKQVAQCEADRKAAADAAELKRAELQSNVADLQAALANVAEKLGVEAEKLRALQERNVALRARTEAAKAAADKSARAFQQEYDARPPECNAALQAMAAACPALGGY